IATAGDLSSAPITQLGGTGVFVSALREALLAGDIDLAVHSYKDLPTAPAEGLTIGAVPPREDPRDVLISRDGLALDALPHGARIGTGAPRRVAQLSLWARRAGASVTCVPIRGNVDTRIRKVAQGELDAVVLAYAGVARLDRLAEVTEVLDPEVLLPAPAQGALAVECRSQDTAMVDLLTALDDPVTRAAVVAERALLAALEAGCSAPVGALARVRPPGEPGSGEPELQLHGGVIALDGSAALRRSASGPLHDADAIGRRLAVELLDAGAMTLMGSTA
ncbi:MAG TPA: hydroxymethylbilane synthase, partial [Kribbellaceae bacterium]